MRRRAYKNAVVEFLETMGFDPADVIGFKASAGQPLEVTLCNEKTKQLTTITVEIE